MSVFNDRENILSVFGAPARKILLIRIGRQIHKTTFAASLTQNFIVHRNLSLGISGFFPLVHYLTFGIDLKASGSTGAKEQRLEFFRTAGNEFIL